MDDATASDNCGEVTIEVSSETTPGDAAGNYTITRTFTATDDAGNSDTATQIITVQDTTAPTFTFVPEEFSVTCSSELPEDYGMAEATDNCGETTVEASFEEVPGDVEGAYTPTPQLTMLETVPQQRSMWRLEIPYPKEIAIAMATSLTHLEYVAATVWQIQMETEFVMSLKSSDVRM